MNCRLDDCSTYCAYTKPASRDYLNLSISPRAHVCNASKVKRNSFFTEMFTDYPLISLRYESNKGIVDNETGTIYNQFCECIHNMQTYLTDEKSPSLGSALAWAEESRMEWRTDTNTNINVWDLSGECYERWYYKLSSSPIGYSPNSKGLYAINNQGCSLSWSNNSFNSDVHEYVHLYYRRSKFVRRDLAMVNYLDTFPQYANSFACVKHCSSNKFQYAFVSLNSCHCSTSEKISALPMVTGIEDLFNICSDFPTMRCGSNTTDSVYKFVDSKNFGFRFWQCLNLQSSKVYEQIYEDAKELTIYQEGLESTTLCLEICGEVFGKKVSVLALIVFDNSVKTFKCRCIYLKFFKARREDISRLCLQGICLDTYSPCTTHSTVYTIFCRGKDCDHSLLMNSSNHCDPPYYRQLNPVQFPNVYFVCESEDYFMYKWKKVVCQKDESFDPSQLKCIRAAYNFLCTDIDGRNITWIVKYKETGVKSCFEGMGRNLNEAYWTCGEGGKFITKEPDRTNCFDPWINDYLDQIFPTDLDAVEMTQEIKEKLESSPMFGGTLLKTPKLLNTILDKQIIQKWNRSLEENRGFTKNILEMMDNIFHHQDLAWEEFHNKTEHHLFTFKLLGYVEEIGISLLDYVTKTNKDCRFSERYASHSSKLLIEMASTEIWEESLFGLNFARRDAEIFIPWSAFENQTSREECLITVGSIKKLKKNDIIDPSEEENVELGNTILSFMVMPSHPINGPVRLTFDNTNLNRLEGCIYWDTITNKWSNDGCSIINVHGPQVTCICNHLTSFSVLFGSKNPNDPFKQGLTLTLGSISTVALIFTQIFLHVNFSKQRGRASKFSVELNRNYCLLLGQLTTMLIQDLHHKVSRLTCKVIALWSQYIWTAAFTWFGLEGRLLYRVLIVVINAHQSNIYLLYAIGYGFPLLVVTFTIIAGVHFQDDDNFVQQDVCWLEGKYILGFMVPLAIVLAWNTYVLIKGTIVTYDYCRKQKDVTFGQQFSSLARSGLTLSYILGVPWILGFFSQIHEAFEFIFIICSSMTGFVIFLNSIRVMEVVKKIVDWTSLRASSRRSTSLVPSNKRRHHHYRH
nr:latrophilin-like protein 1 [Lepeophtheirus salmonis]XP_040572784.1 latrophilin-like protein 1 [Lepeophtheirus salmonis]